MTQQQQYGPFVYFISQLIMFSWARKERLSERKSSSSFTTQCIQTTDGQSYPSSPAHSHYQMNSRAKYITPPKKLKVVLYKKEKEKTIASSLNENIQNSLTKSKLIDLINSKNKGRSANKPSVSHQVHQCPGNNQKAVKIKIEVNRILDQYCRTIKEVANNETWSIFSISLVMLKMGFIHDLVNDREIVKQLWTGLEQPDKLSFYVYLEQAIGNRVHMDLAISSMCDQLQISTYELSKQSAIRIISQKKCSNLHEILKLNRLCRKKQLPL